MSLKSALRGLLAIAAALVVVWAIVDVLGRAAQTSQRSSAGTITLTLLHWGDKEEEDIVDEGIAGFEKLHPGIKIKRLHAPYDNYLAKTKTMFASGDPPDLFYMLFDWVGEFNDQDLIYPIQDYLDEEIRSAAATQPAMLRGAATQPAHRVPPWMKDFYPKIVDAFRYQDGEAGVGPLHGVPKDFTTWLFYINVDLFERARVKGPDGQMHPIRIPYDGWTWDEFETDMKAIAVLTTDPKDPVYGGIVNSDTHSIWNVIWSYGGDFFGEKYSDLKLDSPETRAALEMLHRTRFVDQRVYDQADRDKASGIFVSGKAGCLGPFGRWKTPNFRKIEGFRWDVVPMPHAAGTPAVSSIATVAWVIAKNSKHPREAYEAIKFLTGEDAQRQCTKLGLSIPSNRIVAMENPGTFLDPTQSPPHHQVFLDEIDYARIPRMPRGQQFEQILDNGVDSATRTRQRSIPDALADIDRNWKAELASPLRRTDHPPMPWVAVAIIAVGVLATIVALGLWRGARQRVGSLQRAHERAGWLFISPWIVGFLLFTLGPMLVSLLLSFSKWTAMAPLGHAQYVGAGNYSYLFTFDSTFWTSLKVTGWYVLLVVPVGQALALAIAILMNARVRGITVFRTLYFMPAIVSGVGLSTLWLWMFEKQYGLINNVLRFLHLPAPDWFGGDAPRAAVPALAIMTLWGVGGGMVIYLAGLKGVPQSLYEAARIDGANAWQRFTSVTLPMLSPLIFFNLVMGIIGSFQVFTQAFVLGDSKGGPNDATLFYVLNLYRQAFVYHNMGYASAMAWVLFALVLVLTLIVFRGSRRLVYYEALKP